MSRVAKNPIKLPKGVEITLSGQKLALKGKQGNLELQVNDKVTVEQEADSLSFKPKDLDKKAGGWVLAGTTRALVQNMITGVAQGFEKKLQLVGVGYRAQAKGKVLGLTLGFSHPIEYTLPQGITVETPSQTEVIVKGVNKQLVGQVAAEIRRFRPPEPYKGKGVRYVDEHIIRKEAKKK